MVPRVLDELASEEMNTATDYRYFKLPQVWELFHEYYERASQRPDKKMQAKAVNLLALYGVASGHYDEAADAFRRLDVDPVQPTDPETGNPAGPFLFSDYDSALLR